MKEALKVFNISAFAWAVYMLVLFIFLSLCVELNWTFIYNLPEIADRILKDGFLLLFRSGVFGVPVLTVGSAIFAAVIGAKEKSAKTIDLPFLGCTAVFAVTAVIIALIDSSTIAVFLH